MMNKGFKFLLITLILGVGVLGITAVSPTNASEAIRPFQQTAVDPRFGAIESFWAPGEAAELGVGWERILFYWNEIQPNDPGDWNTLHVHEEWLDEAGANGRQVVGLLKNTPNWATDGDFASGVPRGLYLPVNDPGNLWANYVRQIANYYGPRGVHNWIIWNEPDIAPNVYGHEFSGTTEDYYQLVKVAYQVMKQADPQTKIHIGGMTHWHDPSYLRKFLQVVVNDPEAAENDYFFDVLTYHIYFRPETIPGIVGNGYAVQQQLGIQPFKEVWINETNARPSMDPEWPVEVQAFHIDLEQQAWYIPQAYALGFYAGANRIGFYKLIDINMNPGDESWGLIRPYDFSKRPAFYAYKNTIKYLAGFQYPIKREQSGNHYLFTFNRPQGVTRLMWAKNQAAVTLNVAALAESAVLVDPITEAETPITPEGGFYEIRLEGARCHVECLMGGPPVLLIESGVTADDIPTSPPPAAEPVATSTPIMTGTATADPIETAVITPTVTLETEPTATITATITATTTAEPTASPTPSHTPTPEPTATRPLPTATHTATPVLSEAEVVVLPTEPPATEVAVLSPTGTPILSETEVAVPNSAENVGDNGNTAVAGIIPPEQASWWFIGAGLGLTALLIGLATFRRK